MKGPILFIILLFAIADSYAQEPADALRYSWLTQNGTARNQAIGGAGASLGGEFSSLFINPAGLGFYKTNEFVLTPGYAIKNSQTNYFNTPEDRTGNNFNLGASGFLFSATSSQKKIKSLTFALGFNRTADFNSHSYFKGKNTNSSYSEKYLEELVNDKVTDPNVAATKYPSGSSLAFNTYLIDTISGSNGSVLGFRTLADPNLGLIQENTIKTSGGITDFSIGAGLNLQEKLYFGATLSFDFLNYRRSSQYKETDATGIATNNFNYFEANETLKTSGVGGNVKLGVIYKPVEDVRLGLTFQTPTAYQLNDSYSTEIITDVEGYGGAGIKKQSTLDLNQGQPLEAKYNMNTPLKVMFGGSLIFREVADVKKQRGFITADVEYINYKGAAFKAADKTDASAKDYYSSLDQVIRGLYKNTFNIRAGGELKFNTYMVRAGGAYYGNPYKNQNANIFKISGGLGYRNKGIFVDLTYVYTLNKDVNYPYLLQDKPNNPVYLKNTGSSIIATIGFKI